MKAYSSELDDERWSGDDEMCGKMFPASVDPPWDLASSPGACCCGCGGASGSWGVCVRHIPDGACGTRPAVEGNAAQCQTES